MALLVVFGTVGAVAAEDWPHWRGPHRDGKTSEHSGWPHQSWPAMKPAWQADVGRGSSSPVVVGEHVFVLGWKNKQDHLQCLDAATGRQQWVQAYSAPKYGRKSNGDQGLYDAVTSTPEFDPQTGGLYTLGIDGDLNCWATRRAGRRVWHLNLYDEFDVPSRPKVGRSGQRDYGYTSSPLVYGDWLIVEVGAASGNLIGFDKRTGKILWRSAANDASGHNGGPVPITVEGIPCIAVHTFEGLLVVRLDKPNLGKTVATYPWKTDFANNIATVAVHENEVLLTSAYNHYKIAKIRVALEGAKLIWQQKYPSKVCTPVIHAGRVYFSWRKLHCLDFATGKLLWQGGSYGDPGSCILTADDRLVVWGNSGDLALVETAARSPDRFQQLALRRGLGTVDAWPHVALANRQLYCRDRSGRLTCFRLSDEP